MHSALSVCSRIDFPFRFDKVTLSLRRASAPPLCHARFLCVPSARTRPLLLRARAPCWLTIIINSSDFWFKLFGFFIARLRGRTTARSESRWKWWGRGSSKASAGATGLPSPQQQEEPCAASKPINLRFPTAETPFYNEKKNKKQNYGENYLKREGDLKSIGSGMNRRQNLKFVW